MKKLIAAALATTALCSAASAQEITEFRLGILGGENAQDRLASNQCYADKIAEALGVEVKVFTPADYNGVMQGLLGGLNGLQVANDSRGRKRNMCDQASVLAVDDSRPPSRPHLGQDSQRHDLTGVADDREPRQFVDLFAKIPLIANANRIAFATFDRTR